MRKMYLWIVGQFVDCLLNKTTSVLVLANSHQVIITAKKLDEETPSANWKKLNNFLENVNGTLVSTQWKEVESTDFMYKLHRDRLIELLKSYSMFISENRLSFYLDRELNNSACKFVKTHFDQTILTHCADKTILFFQRSMFNKLLDDEIAGCTAAKTCENCTLFSEFIEQQAVHLVVLLRWEMTFQELDSSSIHGKIDKRSVTNNILKRKIIANVTAHVDGP